MLDIERVKEGITTCCYARALDVSLGSYWDILPNLRSANYNTLYKPTCRLLFKTLLRRDPPNKP